MSFNHPLRRHGFQPYRMVKDLRAGVQTSNLQVVMDADLDAYVDGWLRAGCPLKRIERLKDEEKH